VETFEIRKHLLTLLLSRQRKKPEATFKTCELFIYEQVLHKNKLKIVIL
jgi:hypothetical protein